MFNTLCGARHNVFYAEFVIMPSRVRGRGLDQGVRGGSLGITAHPRDRVRVRPGQFEVALNRPSHGPSHAPWSLRRARAEGALRHQFGLGAATELGEQSGDPGPRCRARRSSSGAAERPSARMKVALADRRYAESFDRSCPLTGARTPRRTGHRHNRRLGIKHRHTPSAEGDESDAIRDAVRGPVGGVVGGVAGALLAAAGGPSDSLCFRFLVGIA